MPLFINLGKFTDQGLKNIKQVEDNSQNVVAALPAGTKVHGIYVPQGQYDLVVISESPDAETDLKGTAALSANDNTRWETMSAVTMDRFRELLQS
ncbi:MAG: GYD domain-containing protein [Dehalococcoidia bacterium]